MVVTATIGDEVRDSTDLKAMQLCELHEVWEAGHRAVVIHDLADHTRWIQSGEPRDVYGCFRMTGAHQGTAVTGNEREYVARHNNIVRALCRINRHGNRVRAIMRGNTRRNALLRLDGNSERRPMRRCIEL